jgi:hypothetical protein
VISITCGSAFDDSYLERLRIPVLHLFDRGHFTEPIWQLSEILDAVGEADGELFGEKLRGTEQSAYTWVG